MFKDVQLAAVIFSFHLNRDLFIAICHLFSSFFTEDNIISILGPSVQVVLLSIPFFQNTGQILIKI